MANVGKCTAAPPDANDVADGNRTGVKTSGFGDTVPTDDEPTELNAPIVKVPACVT